MAHIGNTPQQKVGRRASGLLPSDEVLAPRKNNCVSQSLARFQVRGRVRILDTVRAHGSFLAWGILSPEVLPKLSAGNQKERQMVNGGSRGLWPRYDSGPVPQMHGVWGLI